MLSVNEIKANCMSVTYHRGRQLYETSPFKDIEIYEEEDSYNSGDMCIEGKVKGNGTKWYETKVLTDAGDNILDYECTCPAYESYYGMCKHCVALALLYRENQKRSERGQASFQTDEEALMLQKTDSRRKLKMNQPTAEALKSMIEKYAVKDKMHLFGGYYKKVELIPEISRTYRGYEIEFKIGAQRMYVVKNIARLISDVEQVNDSGYGKNFQFVHDRSAFTDHALLWIDVMSSILKNQLNTDDLMMYTYDSNLRTIQLSNDAIEQIFETFMDDTLVINDKEYCIKNENPSLTLEIMPQSDEGALLSMKETEYIHGSDRIYAVQNKTIKACSKDFVNEVWPLIETLGAEKGNYLHSNQKLYLNKQDYEAFCGNVLPRIEKYIKVNNQGVDFSEFMPKEPEFSLYISQDENDSQKILAKAEVAYGTTTFDLIKPLNLASDYRNIEKEVKVGQLLKKYFKVEDIDEGRQFYVREDEDVYLLVTEGLEAIKAQMPVFIDEKFRGVNVIDAPKVAIGVSISGELLEMNVQTEEMSMDEIYDILSTWHRRKKYYRMKNGDFMRIEDNSIAVLSELTQGLGLSRKQLEDGKMLLPKYRTNYIDTVLRKHPENIEIERSSDFKKIGSNMREYVDSDFEVPKNLNAKLRNYQKDGYRWLSTLAEWGFGGILADDMGLGKTVQMLAFLLAKRKRALIVCPASLVYNWAGEVEKFTPDLKAVVIAGTGEKRRKEYEDSRLADITITSYDLLKRDIDEYKDRAFDYMVIDEAQYIKNASTQAAKAVKEVQAGVRFAMTGTPIENKLSDLWSIFDFIMPGYLYNYKYYKDEIEGPIVQQADEAALKRLQTMVRPFILRRKKQDVLKDLPEKQEEVVYTQMNEQQRKLYQAHVLRLRAELANKTEDEFKQDSIRYIAELTKLRQICCSPELIYEDYHAGSGKLDTCMQLILSAVEGNHHVLLFSQFTQMLDVIREQLEKRQISYLYLSGKNSKLQRKQMVDAFQQGGISVFLISLKAGGTGLNLTMADIVIHYDPWWNIAAQNQATDRAHRIGQKNAVNVMKLVAKDSIEESIIKLQEQKARLSEDVIEGKDIAEYRLSKDEILGLLEDRAAADV